MENTRTYHVPQTSWWHDDGGFGGGVGGIAISRIIIDQLTWPYFYDPNLNNRLSLYYNTPITNRNKKTYLSPPILRFNSRRNR